MWNVKVSRYIWQVFTHYFHELIPQFSDIICHQHIHRPIYACSSNVQLTPELRVNQNLTKNGTKYKEGVVNC